MKLNIRTIAFLLLTLTLSIGVSKALAADVKPTLKVEVHADLKANQDARKDIRDTRKEDVKNIRTDAKGDLKADKDDMMKKRDEMKANGTLTPDAKAQLMLDFKTKRTEIKKTEKQDIFKARKEALVKELNVTLTNLGNIRGRINDRITALDTAGKPTTDAKAALTIADGKIASAKVVVDAFVALATPSASSTTEVDLTKPRQQGDAAIKAVKDARGALIDVVKLLMPARDMKVTATTTATVNP